LSQRDDRRGNRSENLDDIETSWNSMEKTFLKIYVPLTPIISQYHLGGTPVATGPDYI